MSPVAVPTSTWVQVEPGLWVWQDSGRAAEWPGETAWRVHRGDGPPGAVPADTDGLVRGGGGPAPGEGAGSENRATRCAGVNEPWASAAGGHGPRVLEAMGLSDAPPVVKCAAVGHPWPPWEYVPPKEPGQSGFYWRSCPACPNKEVRHPCAM